MRSSEVRRLLREQAHEFNQERLAWIEERNRLLDRIMVLADRPMPPLDDTPFSERAQLDVLDPDSALGEDLFAVEPL